MRRILQKTKVRVSATQRNGVTLPVANVYAFFFSIVRLAMLSLIILAAEAVERPLARTHMQMHRSLLGAVFQDVDPDIVQTTARGRPVASLCDWQIYDQGMQLFSRVCAEAKLTHLAFMGFASIGAIHYEFLPPGVKDLVISRCAQCYVLHTRLLPWDLRELNMEQNNIYGTIDMQNLPQKIEVFDVSQNCITGPISRQRLPPTLKKAELWDNKIKQRFVPCDPLPPVVTRKNLQLNKVREIHFAKGEGGDYSGNGRIEEIMPGMKITTHIHLKHGIADRQLNNYKPVWTQSTASHGHREIFSAKGLL